MDGISNVWSVVVAALSGIVLGTLWYGPLFQKPWMKYVGLTKESMKSMAMTPLQAVAGGFVTAVLTAYVFAWLAQALGLTTAGDALGMAFWTWVGFAVPLSASGWLWEGKSYKLSLIYAGYYLVSWSAAALIVTLWK